MSTNRLETIAVFDGMTLYKRVASNGSSAWAFIHGPAYVLTNAQGEVIGEYDWESDAIGKMRGTEPCAHGIHGNCLVCSSPEEMAKKQTVEKNLNTNRS